MKLLNSVCLLIVFINIFLLVSYDSLSQNNLMQEFDVEAYKRIDSFVYPSPLIDNAGWDIPRHPPIIDTFNFKYNFRIGDTLIYVAMSKDSITIDYGPPLLRIRQEKIIITCDSITPTGHFVLKQQLIEFKSKESYLKERNVERNTTPWLNTSVYIELDTMGIRHKQYNKDSLKLATPPGGVFQPFILLPLNAKDSINTKLTNQSWMLSDSSYILENGSPYPVFRYSLFYRIVGCFDTLDIGKSLKMNFSMTSQAAHRINTEDIKMLTTSINNAGGEFFLDTTYWIPKFYIHTMVQRLTIEDRIGKGKQSGFHYIHTTFLLDKFIKGKEKKKK